MPGLQDPGLRWKFRYLSTAVLKTHYPLLALYLPVAVACGAGVVFGIRSLKTPDVGLIKNKTAWDNIPPTYQFQAYSPEKNFYYKVNKDNPKVE